MKWWVKHEPWATARKVWESKTPKERIEFENSFFPDWPERKRVWDHVLKPILEGHDVVIKHATKQIGANAHTLAQLLARYIKSGKKRLVRRSGGGRLRWSRKQYDALPFEEGMRGFYEVTNR